MVKHYRLKGETDDDVVYRIGLCKNELGSWEYTATILNKILGTNYSESKYRKQFKRIEESKKEKELLTKPENIEDKQFEKNIENYIQEIEAQKEELKKERIKLQTTNVEKNRLDRAEARQELYYENIGNIVSSLPVPKFLPLMDSTSIKDNKNDDPSLIPSLDTEFLLCLSDMHYGAEFSSTNNQYNPSIAEERLEFLEDKLFWFVQRRQISKIHIACLGDTLQGNIHLTDLAINHSSVTCALVNICRLIASFLNRVSSFVKVEYYHVPTSNHTQIRPLGTKANELPQEDLEYVMSHYIFDLCKDNTRISIHIAKDTQDIPVYNINGSKVVFLHGHQIKNIDTAIKDVESYIHKDIDYLICGHFHSGKSFTVSTTAHKDKEVIVCPSFIGSDPYADTLMKDSKAAVNIYGFEKKHGHTQTYKIILN